MIKDLIQQRVAQSEAVHQLEEFLHGDKRIVEVTGLAGSLTALLLAYLFEKRGEQLLCVSESPESSDRLKEDLDTLLGKGAAASFPSRGKHRYGLPGEDIASRSLRLETLQRLIEGEALIVVATAESAMSPLPAPGEVAGRRIELAVGKTIDFEGLVAQLVDLGFNREEIVELPGDMSVRGGLIDLFPYSSEAPVRVEFFGDQVESIREFDPATQRSRSRVDKVVIYPQHTDGGEGSDWLKEGSLLDYLNPNTLIFIDHPDLIRAGFAPQRSASDEDGDLWDWQHHEEEREVLMTRWAQFEEGVRERPSVWNYAFRGSETQILDFGARPPESFHGSLKVLRQRVEEILQGENSPSRQTEVFFLCETQGHAHRMTEIFADEGMEYPNLHVGVCPLHSGFVFPQAGLVVYTDHEFYGRIRRLRLPRRFRQGLTPRQLRTLNVGDFVVHVDHGIGVYRGLKKISVHGHERECLQIEYRDGDIVYVPLERMDRVQKYSSREGMVPRLSKLGSPEWDRLKARTKKRVQDIARELIELYAARKAMQGHAFSSDTPWQRELEASFVYEETPDQLRAILEVKRDMESPKPMDRLVCGDVGYGKTEVAIRAAFKAVMDGKQVAMLVPTTVLAQQHYGTFRQRLEKFPIKVEMLSRFRTAAEQKQVVHGLKKGIVDIVIGTHRLLSKDVEFRNLGLLIIDEEQRFGVRHKERLKALRATVDVLTLTATPIPRTLHMSLMGARDMSNINTPPRNRLPIVTEVVPFNRDFIRQAILREVERGGQVFFVHNRVKSIYKVAAMLESLLPDVSFAVAHGQMSERELERVMLDFIDEKYQVLVSTMIIESGLDISNVNTILVNRADKFGLAQLYQLRGRVGRSERRAYCYLLIPPIEMLTPEAIKRLQTVEEFTDLGSGFQIAMRDLEIRGAGNLLGAEQSGFIDALGFDLYCRILDEAVAELKEERDAEIEGPKTISIDTKLDFDGDAYLPQEYVSIGSERVNLYRRLVEADSLDAIDAIRDELRDRFGRLPLPAENLLHYVSFKLLGSRLGLQKLRVGSEWMVGYFAPEVYQAQQELSKEWLGSIVQRAPGPFEFVQDEGLGFRVELPSEDPHRYGIEFLRSLVDGQVHEVDLVVQTA
jgi:transcription-repair coupling factor (superfamily II helicase)